MVKTKEKVDPRIIRTRQLLRDAFIDLLLEMDIKKISVNRLAERATINRVTFYLHYKDITDMMDKMADDMVEDISSVIEEARINRTSKQPTGEVLSKCLEHIAANANFYKVVLTTRGVPVFKDRLMQLLVDKIMSGIENRGNESFAEKASIQKEILIWYDSSALIGTIVAWLRNDMPYSPNYLAQQFALIHNRHK
ncbi:TetR/AcrR family transcriptional regulator [Gracilibacillus caseinilyticus]|uniref:TetR/AcrR family transcriptional regulator n=1 Tax=Gracilibacillus caseinilyticus TaxID=2932256 RepID=A0ABY4EW40_9BACI|nr:TetR/AcrR family transcriptional regulator [Gracilibacillus caseinilyticus]UOQ48625.1 TetR/AcrR family transcriptional regulator [Gracilibacillus caseinilyticus]